MTAAMNLRRIEAFLTVADTRSISRAAAKLEVAQSVVSRHVAALEAQIGARLFERTGRGVALTPAGQRLAPQVSAALEHMRRAIVEAAEVGDQPNGDVRIGVAPAAARPLVGMLYQRISERYPRVRLTFVESFSTDLEQRLAEGSLDLAIMNRYSKAKKRDEEPLCVVDSLLVGPAGSLRNEVRELPFARLVDFPLVLASRPNSLRVALDQASRRMGAQLQVVVEADSVAATKDLIAQAGLYAVLPHQLVHEELKAGTFAAARLVAPSLPRTLSLARSTLHPATAASRVTAHEIRTIVQGRVVRSVWR